MNRGNVERRSPLGGCALVATSSMPRCAIHNDTLLESKKKGWYCEECGENVLSYEQFPRADSTDQPGVVGVDLESLPSLIAIPLAEYVHESDALLKLWSACETVEVTLRLALALSLAEIERASAATSAGLRFALAEHIEAPSMGTWRWMAGQAAQQLPANGLLPELRGYLERSVFPLVDGAGTVESSMLALRNRMAHGGGLTRALANELLNAHGPRFDQVLRAGMWLGELELVAPWGVHGPGVLAGPHPGLTAFRPRNEATQQAVNAVARRDTVVLVRGEVVLPLGPLAAYGIPRSPDKDAATSATEAPQVYARRHAVGLLMTPLGSDDVAQAVSDDAATAEFERCFRRDALKRATVVLGFEDDLRRDSGRLIGREAELAVLEEFVANMREGVIWVAGRAGIGKSSLMARVAVRRLDLGHESEMVLAYRFKAGSARCRQAQFLTFACERLRPWVAGPTRDETNKRLPDSLEELQDLLERVGGRRVVIILDGLDELAEVDSGFARRVPLGMRAPGVLWVCSGRMERGLPEAFLATGAVEPFPGGLPGMSDDDIGTMLLCGLGRLGRRLAQSGRDIGDRVVNDFIAGVARRADGLPAYVQYVIGDVQSGMYRSFDETDIRRLPSGLHKYHEQQLGRCQVGILHQVMTPLIGTLAVAHEPLSIGALHTLLSMRNAVSRNEDGLRQVREALGSVAAMVRRTRNVEAEEAYALWHASLRDYLLTSPEMRDVVETARHAMADAVERWQKWEQGPVAPYLFRHGISHQIEASRSEESVQVLGDFGYLMSRTATIADVVALVSDIVRVRAELPAVATFDLSVWESFLRERTQLLSKCNDEWSMDRILLQLAVEHADDSPVTIAAERWLERGECDWTWIRRMNRPKTLRGSEGGRIVLVGHSFPPIAVVMSDSGRAIVSVASGYFEDRTIELIVWDAESHRALAMFRESYVEHDPIAFQRLAVVRDDGTALIPGHPPFLWRTDTGQFRWSPTLMLNAQRGSESNAPPIQAPQVSWMRVGTTLIVDPAPVDNRTDEARSVRDWRYSVRNATHALGAIQDESGGDEWIVSIADDSTMFATVFGGEALDRSQLPRHETLFAHFGSDDGVILERIFSMFRVPEGYVVGGRFSENTWYLGDYWAPLVRGNELLGATRVCGRATDSGWLVVASSDKVHVTDGRDASWSAALGDRYHEQPVWAGVSSSGDTAVVIARGTYAEAGGATRWYRLYRFDRDGSTMSAVAHWDKTEDPLATLFGELPGTVDILWPAALAGEGFLCPVSSGLALVRKCENGKAPPRVRYCATYPLSPVLTKMGDMFVVNDLRGDVLKLEVWDGAHGAQVRRGPAGASDCGP